MDRSFVRSALRRVAGLRLSKITGLLLAAALTAALGAAPASATALPTLRVTAPRSVAVGEAIILRLSVVGSTDLAGYETNLLFDTSAAHFNGLAQRRNDLRRLGRDVATLGPEEIRGGVAFGLYTCPARDCVTRAHPAPGIGHEAVVSLATAAVVAEEAGALELRLAASKFVDSAGREIAVRVPDSFTVRVRGAHGKSHPAPAATWSLPHDVSRSFGRVDLTGDAIVGVADAMAARYSWAMTRIPSSDPCRLGADDRSADVNGDGCIDVADLQGIAGRYSPVGARPLSFGDPTVRTTTSHPTYRVSAVGPFAITSMTYVVDSTGDQPDANNTDGICATSGGACTLRAAMDTANRHVGNDRVEFAIPGSGVKTITLGSRLPIINEQNHSLTIDGYTQPGSSPNTDQYASNAILRIQVTGPGETVAFPAFVITSAKNTIRGIAVYRMWRDIVISGAGAHNNAIVGSFVGTNAAGTYSTPSWNHANGALIIDAAGNNRIGRPVLADRNVISGGPASGVYHTHEGATGNLVQNNIVGLSPLGDRRLPNKLEGVDYNFGASFNQDGGTGALEHNVQSGNSRTGAETSHGLNTQGNRFIGNYVGTDLTGKKVLAWTYNDHYGIHIEDGSFDMVVTDNVIAGNRNSGVRIDGIGTHNTYVARNLIGLTLDGTAGPNAVSGIRVVYRTQGGLIEKNVIANNPVGIEVRDADNDFFTFSQNSIYANTGLGIDIQPVPGVNPNDVGDGDTGGNDQLNFPVLGTATPSTVTGTACGGCIVEVFLADSGAGQYGEGKTFVGSATAAAAGSFAASVSGLSPNQYVTATATDPDGNTSEFSLNTKVGAASAIASDTFTRSATDTWGTADSGGPYTMTGTKADFDVAATYATITLGAPGTNRAAHLLGVDSRDVDITFRVRPEQIPATGNLFVYGVARQVSAGNEYRAKLRIATGGTVFVSADRVVGGVTSALGPEVQVPGLVLDGTGWVAVHARFVGASPTAVSIRAWAGGTAEPPTWTFTASDSEAVLQDSGAVGLRAYVGSAATGTPIVVRFDDYQVTAP